MNSRTDNHPDEYDIDDLPEDMSSAEYDEDSYSLEDDDPELPEDNANTEDEEGEREVNAKRLNHTAAWKLMLRMMVNPVEGWKNIRRASASVEDVAKECFYPITGAAALSCFVECLWKNSIGLNLATINALKIFVAFFFGNYLILLLISWLFPREQKEIADSDFCKKFVMYNLSTLALFCILYNCLPMIGPILVFLPIWTIYLVLRGSRFFMFPTDKASLLRTLLCIFIIGTPIAVYWTFDLFIRPW